MWHIMCCLVTRLLPNIYQISVSNSCTLAHCLLSWPQSEILGSENEWMNEWNCQWVTEGRFREVSLCNQRIPRVLGYTAALTVNTVTCVWYWRGFAEIQHLNEWMVPTISQSVSQSISQEVSCSCVSTVHYDKLPTTRAAAPKALNTVCLHAMVPAKTTWRLRHNVLHVNSSESKVKPMSVRTEVKSHAAVAQLRYAGRGKGQ